MSSLTLTSCTQVCCGVRPQAAHAQLCAEHPVLHDVWGDRAHLAHHGEQPENSEWISSPLLFCGLSSVFRCRPSVFSFSRRQTSMMCSAITPASWTTAWRTACWPTPSSSGSSPNSCPSASSSQTACRFVDVMRKRSFLKKQVSIMHSYENAILRSQRLVLRMFLYLVALHSEHEVGASLFGARDYGWASLSERTCWGGREEEADHKGISKTLIPMGSEKLIFEQEDCVL